MDAPDWNDLNAKAAERAEARANMIYMQELRKSKKAELMHKAEMAGVNAANAQEREAYRSPDYKTLLVDLREAVELYELRDMQLKLLFTRVDVWRTKQSNQRAAINAGG